MVLAERATDERGRQVSGTRAILFDLDGTLIDTTGLILCCFDHSWQTVCGRIPARAGVLATFGIPLREAMLRLGADADLAERLVTEYRQYNSANHDLLARPFTGVRQTVCELRARGYLTGVVTSKSRELALRGLKLCELDALIDAAVFLEDTARHKPAPEPILAALEKLSVEASAAIYVGDSPHDMAAGRAAGVRTAAALWGSLARAELEREGPDYLLESPDELLEIFRVEEKSEV